MRKFGRKLKYTVLWAAAVSLSLGVLLFAVSIASYFALLYPPVQERALRFAEEKMSDYFAGTITIRRVESNLLSSISIYGFRAIGRSEHRDSITAEQITVSYWIPALFRKHVRVLNVRAYDVRGHIVMEPGNRIRLPFLPAYMDDSTYKFGGKGDGRPPNPDDWPVKIFLGRAEANGINAVYRDLSNNMVGEIKNATARARFHAVDSFSVWLAVPQASYQSPWWDGAIDTIGASGVITWRNLRVHSMLLSGSGTRVTGGGLLSYFSDGQWDLKANFKTPVRPVPILYAYLDGLGRDGVLEGSAAFGGRLYEPLYSAKVKGSGITLSGHRFDSFNVDAAYGRDEFGRVRLRGHTGHGRFDVNASLLMKHLNRGPEIGDYSVSAVVSELDAKSISDELGVTLPALSKYASVRLKADGYGIAAPSSIELSAELDGGDIVSGPLSLNAAVRGGRWDIGGSWGANRFDGGGQADLARGTLSGTLGAEIPEPSAISRTFAREHVTGRLSASASIEGRVGSLSAAASLRGKKVRWRGMQADSLDAHVTVADGVPRLSRAEAYIFGRVDSVASYFGYKSVRGYVETDFSMKDGADGPLVDARVLGKELFYGGYSLEEAVGSLEFEKDTLRWSGLRLREKNTLVHSGGKLKLGGKDKRGYDMALSADAELYLARDGEAVPAGRMSFSGAVRGDSLKASCRVASAPLELLDPWIPEVHRVRGVFSLDGEFSGTPANPGGRVNFQVIDPRYYGSRAFTLVGHAALADSVLSGAAMLRMSENSGAVELMANLPFLPSAGWKLDETGKRAAQVLARSQSLNVAAVTGFLEPDVSVSGVAEFDARIRNAGHGWGLSGTFSLQDGRVRYAPKNIDVKNISLSASASGTLEEPLVEYTLASGPAEIPPIRVERSAFKGRSVLDTLFVDEAHLSFMQNSSIDLNGMVLYDGFESLFYGQNFYVQYAMRNLPVEMFSPFVNGYGLNKGVFNGNGVVYAAEGRPLVNGILYLSRLELTIPDITPAVGPVNATLTLVGNTVEVTALDAKWGRGSIHADGRASWDINRLYDMNLNLTANTLYFELPEVVQVGIESAELRVFDRDKDINVRGKLALSPTNYLRDISLVGAINQMQAGVDTRREPNPFLRSIRLRLELDLANNMNVNMNLGSAQMDGRLTIAGSAAEPGIMGEVKVVDGFIYYLDRKFKITEGTLFNPDMTAVNPTLNVVAKSEVTTYSPTAKTESFTITMTLLGTLGNPVVRFTADPALSEIDILSILTFGERMGGMGSHTNDRLVNLAAQQALGLGARRLERILNVDRISVSDVTGSGGSQNAGATVGVTKRFSNRLNLTYETNTGKLSDRKVTAQYRLVPNLYLEGQTTSEGENALDLIFRYSR